MASTVQDTPLKPLRSPGPNVDCRPEQAFFAQRGIWASHAMRRALCDAIIAGLARFPIAGCPILNFVLFAKFRVGTLTRPHRPSRNNSVIPTEAKRSGGTLCFQGRENERPVQAGAKRHPSPRDSRGDSITAKLEDFVILSGATASRSGAVAQSKDPYQLKLADARQGILPCSR